MSKLCASSALAFALFMALTVEAQHQPTLTPQNSDTKNALISVSAVNSRIAWASGHNGTFTVTTDGGKTWRAGTIAGADTLELRDVQAVSDKIAYVLSIGNLPTDFRIYKTEDGGKMWTMQFQNHKSDGFYDCLAFWTPERGLAASDSINGVFPDLRITDGKTWTDIGDKLPRALAGEGSFASSGTCAATLGDQSAWIATGNTNVARVLVTHDGGDTWDAYPTPLASGRGAGAFTIAFRDAQNGIVGGGDLDPKHVNVAAAAVSNDGGQNWTLTNRPPVTGAIYGLSYVESSATAKPKSKLDRTVVITANQGGTAWTPDEGNKWFKLEGVVGYWGVTFADWHNGWLVGLDGRILKISF